MIYISIRLDPNQCLKRIKAAGHSETGAYGENIVCAAVTIILKTGANILFLDKKLETSGNADKPGKMSFSVTKIQPEKREWVKGITDFLLAGLSDLKSQFPDEISLEIVR